MITISFKILAFTNWCGLNFQIDVWPFIIYNSCKNKKIKNVTSDLHVSLFSVNGLGTRPLKWGVFFSFASNKTMKTFVWES